MHHFRGLHKARYLIIPHPQALRNDPIDSKFKTKVELMRHTFFLLKVVLFVLSVFIYEQSKNYKYFVKGKVAIRNRKSQGIILSKTRTVSTSIFTKF